MPVVSKQQLFFCVYMKSFTFHCILIIVAAYNQKTGQDVNECFPLITPQAPSYVCDTLVRYLCRHEIDTPSAVE
jgi:hypothetical protein